ncbi:MAG: hypothetical protein MJZ11_00375 [Lachnospiraceae bacterium]|nr:hypothetical protein [Lachnospiraceae bacterium]
MKKIKYLLGSIILTLLLYGCALESGPDKASYQENMAKFFNNITALDEAINELDTTSEGYADTLLVYLDQLKQTFSQMSELEVPDGFDGVKELAEDASKNMSDAVDKYHTAFESEEYRDDIINRAYVLYSKASTEIQYIIRILHGEKYENLTKTEETN